LKATTAGLAAARATQINAALIILGAIMRAVCKQAIVLDSRCSRCTVDKGVEASSTARNSQKW
jgi:hypothetical protein